MSTPIKPRDPFRKKQKKIGSIVNLEATRQTALAITSSGEEEAPTSRKRAPPKKREGKGVRTSSPIREISQRRKENPPPHVKPEASSRYLCLRRTLRIGDCFEFPPGIRECKGKSILKCFMDLDFLLRIFLVPEHM